MMLISVSSIGLSPQAVSLEIFLPKDKLRSTLSESKPPYVGDMRMKMNNFTRLNKTEPSLGYCRAGVAKGLYIGVFPVGSFGGRDEYDISFSGSVTEEGLLPGDVSLISSDNLDDAVFLDSLDIVIAPSTFSKLGLTSLFPGLVPSSWIDDVDAATGRFRAANVLSERIRYLNESGQIDGVNASVSPLGARAVREILAGSDSLFESLSVLLGAAGLSLAVVRNHGPIDCRDITEPWAEFSSHGQPEEE